ncbi:lysozyme inhibitor LprI family protein [Caproiciproducens sp. CPB-2]|uniref:lysozyme inhibitor LprI family protein n=1 Tax=Caproiciproducens sp. CPB-2 TaxID=3030017 RepID=UPI0023DC4A59|nr:lysozyme inhibitor LprI family protein [Caproiciproducens sp. CPB-2]MDF1494722.1 lysozyme inhibitor LprI family protein [Caproiciproducens sp. CPB-2]
MNHWKKLCIPLAAAVTIAAFAGCGAVKGGESSVPASGLGESSQAESRPASSAQSEPAGSVPVVTPNEPSESQPGPVIDIETDSPEFNALFKKNPIDKQYIAESNKAFSNVEMVNLSNKYAGIWEKEAASAYDKVTKLATGDALSKIKAEQAAWVNGKTEALKKISDEAQAAGGTMAQVNAASATMDYYRSRAAQIYRQLYSFDQNYTYAFK